MRPSTAVLCIQHHILELQVAEDDADAVQVREREQHLTPSARNPQGFLGIPRDPKWENKEIPN